MGQTITQFENTSVIRYSQSDQFGGKPVLSGDSGHFSLVWFRTNLEEPNHPVLYGVALITLFKEIS